MINMKQKMNEVEEMTKFESLRPVSAMVSTLGFEVRLRI